MSTVPTPASPLCVVVLAAGKGTRMRSDSPKVLQPLAGKPLLGHVLGTVHQLAAERTVVVTGFGAQQVQQAFAHQPHLRFALQEPQLGTGHAVQQALPELPDHGVCLVLYGDVPLVSAASLVPMVAQARAGALALLTVELPDPTGYGRILRGAGGAVQGIVEHKDATPEQRAIRESNTGILCAPLPQLRRWLGQLRNDNAQGEYYLTDVVALAVADGVPVQAFTVADTDDVLGVNDRKQLAHLERVVQQRAANRLLESGVTLADPARLDVRGALHCGRDVFIDVGCVFEGEVHLADGVRVGPYAVLRDVRVGAGTVIHPFCHLDGAGIGADALIGPFARLRPTTALADGVHIGNFVEVKNSTLGQGSKANHLSYVGDATVGARVNIGAGTIVANYDGANKHRTVIEDDAHTGSNSVLVAPITVGAGATIGAGSTVAKDVPAGKLTVARARAVTLDGWTRPVKKKSGKSAAE
ncbi:MAG: bifunctional UDP-N-acetylglucosamine diphosphorylase/glucosamine-1-phosphate N-acetyltransferase GlmU [Thiomonas sp.]